MVAAVTDATFAEETKDGLVLIDFWATWCGPCRMQAPILEQLAGEVHEDELKTLQMDMDAIQNTARSCIRAAFVQAPCPNRFAVKDGTACICVYYLQVRQLFHPSSYAVQANRSEYVLYCSIRQSRARHRVYPSR